MTFAMGRVPHAGPRQIWACHLPSLNLSFPRGKIRMKNINFQGLLGLKGILYMRNQQTFFFVKGVIVNVLDFVAIESQPQLLISFVLVGKQPQITQK